MAVYKTSRAKANRGLPREHTGQSEHPLQTHERRLNSWTSNKIDYTFCSHDGEALYSQQKDRPGADCGSDHELFIAKFRLKLKKVGKTTRPFMYDLN